MVAIQSYAGPVSAMEIPRCSDAVVNDNWTFVAAEERREHAATKKASYAGHHCSLCDLPSLRWDPVLLNAFAPFLDPAHPHRLSARPARPSLSFGAAVLGGSVSACSGTSTGGVLYPSGRAEFWIKLIGSDPVLFNLPPHCCNDLGDLSLTRTLQLRLHLLDLFFQFQIARLHCNSSRK